MKKIITISIVVLVLGAIGYGAWWWFYGRVATSEETRIQRETITIEKGTVISTVKATSKLESHIEILLGFDSNGTVTEILVERGQLVKKGDLIARLETTSLELQLAQAEASLAKTKAGTRPEDIASAKSSLSSALANYEKVADGPSDEEIASAESSLKSAYSSYSKLFPASRESEIEAAQSSIDSALAKYNNLLEGKTEDEITVASANLRTAEANLKSAQYAYDAVAYSDSIGMSRQAKDLEQATISYESALANYNISQQEASDEALLSAWSQVVQAQSNLEKVQNSVTNADISAALAQIEQAKEKVERLENTPTEEDLAISQAQVDQAKIQLEKLQNTPTDEDLRVAELQVEQAQLNLDNATLYAPSDGTITAINIDVGEKASAGNVFVMADLSVLHIDILIDEIDIPSIGVGQSARVTFDALPDMVVTGTVTAIAPAPTDSSSGIASYEVTVTLDEQPEQARVGMTANADIETGRRQNVVVVPASVVQVDEETGQTYVELKSDSVRSQRVEVTLGLRSGPNIEVLDGLSEGDEVYEPLSDTDIGDSGGRGLFGGGQGR